MWARGLGCAEETPQGGQAVGAEQSSGVNLHYSVLLLLLLLTLMFSVQRKLEYEEVLVLNKCLNFT